MQEYLDKGCTTYYLRFCHHFARNVQFFPYPQKIKTMKGLHVTIIALFCLFVYTGDGKSSKKGSQANPCFETIQECTEREPSSKGSKGSKGALPYAIWCKEGEAEVCRNKEPKSHSTDKNRYQLGRCGFCGLLSFITRKNKKKTKTKKNSLGNHRGFSLLNPQLSLGLSCVAHLFLPQKRKQSKMLALPLTRCNANEQKVTKLTN